MNIILKSRYSLTNAIHQYVLTAKILVSKETIDVVSATAQFVSFAPGSSQYLLFKDEIRPVWRHSFTAIYTILDR